MVHVISADTCPEAWVKAVTHLRKQKEQYNLIVEIADSEKMTSSDFVICKNVDEFLREHDKLPLITVAGTIFPGGYYKRYGPEGVYEHFPAAYPKMKKGWGCYAMRLLRRPGKEDGETINPLEILVDKMKKQLKGLKMRGVYELGLIDTVSDLPIYDPALDSRRGRTNPCMSHLSFKLTSDKRLLLTVLYRYHYYVEKGLGNLIGLAQLHAFVAHQVGVKMGPMVCHSTLAIADFDGGWKANDLDTLIKKCAAPEKKAA